MLGHPGRRGECLPIALTMSVVAIRETSFLTPGNIFLLYAMGANDESICVQFRPNIAFRKEFNNLQNDACFIGEF